MKIAELVRWDGSQKWERYNLVDGEWISERDGANLAENQGAGMYVSVHLCPKCGQEYNTPGPDANDYGGHIACFGK